MSISAKRHLRKNAGAYFAAAAFCIALGTAYEHFSHGVVSNFMLYMFLWPLSGGVFALLLTAFPGAHCPGSGVRRLWAFGTAALTVGSFMRGVFEIYGTGNPLVKVYWISGAAFMALAASILLCRSQT